MTASPVPSRSRGKLVPDLIAGLTTSLVTIPDGMASAVLAGLNPVQGLYALMVGTPLAALTSSSQFMYVANTGALAVATGSALAAYSGDRLLSALVVLVILVGLLQLALGLLKAGGIVRFVSNGVLVGFMTGIALLIILGQLGDFTGYHSEYSNKVVKAIDLVLHIGQIDFQATTIGVTAILLIIVLHRTPLAKFNMIIALIGASLLAALLGWTDVELISDIADIPSGLGSFPRPVLPDITLIPELLPSAFAVAIIGLVQASGVSKSVPNPDGSYSDVSRDFTAQGLANTAVGFFQGMPIGGAMSETAVNVKAGAQSRWANVFSGIFIIVAVMVFGSFIEYLAMPAIAALLIVAGYEAIKPANIKAVWGTGWAPRLIMVATLVATLILPVQQAVLFGVVVATLQYIYSASVDVNVVELRALGSASFEELPAPRQLAPRQVIVLQVYGSLFYAAAAQIERLLPSVRDAEGAVLILRLRGVQQVGSTFVNIVERYAAKLHAEGGDLLLAEVSEPVYRQFVRTETVALVGEGSVFMAQSDLFAATRQALAAAEAMVQAETRNHSKANRED